LKLLRQTGKKQEELLRLAENETVGISVSDYAAQIETPRDYTATCAYRAKHNCCVSVIGYKPKTKTVYRKKWGKRKMDEEIQEPKQKCDVFFGMFGSNIKPTAEHYNMQREDMEHYLKYGTTLYGEWFLDGKRLPRKDGKSFLDDKGEQLNLPVGPLPDRAGNETMGGDCWTLQDAPFESNEAAARAADFPGFEHHIERTDGSGGQFQGETNAGRIPEALVSGPTKLRRHSVIGVSAHGKGIGDAISNTLTGNLKEGVSMKRLVCPGTRSHVLYLAQNHPRPKGDVDAKRGLWSPQRYFYGFYGDSLWARHPRHFTPPAKKEYHSRCTPSSLDNRLNRYLSRRAFCACPSCAVPKCDFDKCKVNVITGNINPVTVMSVTGTPMQPMTRTLTAFGATLAAGEFRAVNVAEDEKQLEGQYWVVRLVEGMVVADRDFTYGGETILKGFLVAKAQWLQYMKTDLKGRRTYKLLTEERYMNVNAFLRIDALTIKEGTAGSTFELEADEDQRVLNSTL